MRVGKVVLISGLALTLGAGQVGARPARSGRSVAIKSYVHKVAVAMNGLDSPMSQLDTNTLLADARVKTHEKTYQASGKPDDDPRGDKVYMDFVNGQRPRLLKAIASIRPRLTAVRAITPVPSEFKAQDTPIVAYSSVMDQALNDLKAWCYTGSVRKWDDFLDERRQAAGLLKSYEATKQKLT